MDLKVSVDRMRPEDWERTRAIRLRALQEAPDAFGRTLADEEQLGERDWQTRLARSDAVTFIASTARRDIGLVFGAPYEIPHGAAGLFGMWVEHTSRGRGAADRLAESIIGWARQAGYTRLLLDVADENEAAVRLYTRLGFKPNGETGTLPALRTHIREHQRELAL